MKEISMDDKLRLLNGKDFWTTHDLPEDGIEKIVFSDGPTGLRYQPGENDHLGLNESSKATCFPTPAALACSWDPDLVRQVCACIAQEAVEKGVDIVLAPGVNIKRSPLCGRNFEYFSEDPHLTKELGAAFVKGLQENGIGASLKHFAANNQEAWRMSVDTRIDERALHEIYLKAFREIIGEAGPWTVMSAYNRLQGEYCSENRWLLTRLLREEWGYDGLVVSDWSAVNDIVKSINNGMDLEMPSVGDVSFHLLQDAYRNGELEEQAVNRAAGNLRKLSQRCRNAVRHTGRADFARHHEVACKAAAESFVLLKNSRNSLPLKLEENILCIGARMNAPILQGHGSSRVNAAIIDSIPEELSKAGLVYEYEPGYHPDQEEADAALVEKALEAAEQADKIVFFAGLFHNSEAESYDRENLRLPECQDQLIDRLSNLGKELVVILQTGSAVEMPWVQRVDSILQMHLSGQGTGKALADILLGKANPCGRLSETYPEKLSHTPSYLFRGNNTCVEYGESIFTGYRYYDKKQLNVLFPFGHGLSYTDFAYDSLSVERVGEEFLISLKVKNIGAYEGKEVIQLYTGLNESAAIQPVRRLSAFRKIALKPGEASEISFRLPIREFMYYDAGQREFVFATGQNSIEVGKSSRSIELKTTVEITESNRKYAAVTRNTTMGELLSIPPLKETVKQWLDAMLQEMGISGDEAVNARELEQSIFYMPLRSAVQISKGEYPFEELDRFIEHLNTVLRESGQLAE